MNQWRSWRLYWGNVNWLLQCHVSFHFPLHCGSIYLWICWGKSGVFPSLFSSLVHHIHFWHTLTNTPESLNFSIKLCDKRDPELPPEHQQYSQVQLRWWWCWTSSALCVGPTFVPFLPSVVIECLSELFILTWNAIFSLMSVDKIWY